MKPLQTILIAIIASLSCFSTNAGSTAAPLTNAPACIQLRDQFNALETLSFPNTNITLLTIADGKGSEQIPGWVKPVKQRFDARIDIRGIADMSCVPRPLRGLVRTQFRAVQSYPVMLDWTGEAVKVFAYKPGKADILVLDRKGKILYRTSGNANEQSIQDLFSTLDQSLSARTGHDTVK